ncbi:NADP-dependent phosphogluconate dehydrogenase [Marinoscillum furvescens]|uniref:6-phosphogluconate dehydrogenase, decarboxylating n=1 Tax=Marinoscillum furvescens DSM 4134 TaxID=1122208 RepID=A0A3D9L0K5_MARFU|nr:NADP-dependent phosphogluconate dehydrogenase [Marinoscillum furvescens]RED96974.1 6-phosphogluconate dehydrogenase [Marinoscillum furvescens DSM 4134]
MADQHDFGLVGLGVMGRNFILNVADHGFSSMGLDTDPEKVSALKEEGANVRVDGTTDAAAFVAALATPRKIMLLVPAGKPVDAVIETLLPHLEQGDILIDGGNSYYADTERRITYLEGKGINFFGAGVSGGAKGARRGPSIMPGGSKDAYEHVRTIFEAASAKVNDEPCVAYMGRGSAGNYVKMVHNGIEYGLMQLISEIYDVAKKGIGYSNEKLADLFTEWNKGELQSFLVEITAEIFQKKDDLTGKHLVDVILDKAKQKGTGKWTSQNAMDLGIPVPTIDSAVTMREISALKDQRVAADKLYHTPSIGNDKPDAKTLGHALFFAYIVSYAQGMSQLAAADEEYNYGLDMETIAKIWRGGCIIRASLLEDIRKAYDKNPKLSNLLLDEDFIKTLKTIEGDARIVVQFAVASGIPVAGLSSAIAYFDAFRSGNLPLNLIQAQRDHFGSHTYERTDREGIFHTEW